MTRCGELLDDAVVALDHLRRVETVVRLAEQLDRADSVLGRRGPAEGHVELVGCENVAQPHAELCSFGDSRTGEDRELVAAHTCKLVGGLDRSGQRIGEPPQLGVPGCMAVGVVDLLEIVHVAEQ